MLVYFPANAEIQGASAIDPFIEPLVMHLAMEYHKLLSHKHVLLPCGSQLKKPYSVLFKPTLPFGVGDVVALAKMAVK